MASQAVEEARAACFEMHLVEVGVKEEEAENLFGEVVPSTLEEAEGLNHC